MKTRACLTLIRACVQSVLLRQKLPPGRLLHLHRMEKNDRHFLYNRAADKGPLFNVIAWGEWCICVTGLPLCSRILTEHRDQLRPVTISLDSLFPLGFMRQMQGKDHLHYRRILTDAVQTDDFTASADELTVMASHYLNEQFQKNENTVHMIDDFGITLNRIATGMLIRLFYGESINSPGYDTLMNLYRELGPYGLVWNVKNPQRSAYAEIRDFLRSHFSDTANHKASCVTGRIHNDGTLDDTMIGNLIYMVEIGRYDMYSYFKWLTHHAVHHPSLLDQISQEDETRTTRHKSLCEAFTRETLRMDQSERLVRRVQKDFVFEGHLFPKNALVRMCIWESHKSSVHFPKPFEFSPDRFMTQKFELNQFAPFGLDHHRCPMSGTVMKLSAIFLKALAKHYTLAPLSDGPPVSGAYHWEPSPKLSFHMKKR